ncbi:MAG: thioether cross-link-forming SCIFF peptide maturase [Clostridiales bacterium]|jgi:uncharacterized protein|nr:thioether cross-link-forming SCIFF peptide maturase [Clostridiales bacterium]
MIHKYKQKGLNIVIDVNSGAIHIVSDLVYDMLDFYQVCSKDEITDKFGNTEKTIEAYSEISNLVSNNVLFSEDNYKNIADSYSQKRQPVVKALCLLVAQNCNMKCSYCFAGEGEYSGERSLMTFETGKAAIDFLFANSGNRKNLEVDFFGGEPLMNFEVIKKIVAYARSEETKHNKNVRFTLTTNGLLLDEDKLEFINKEMYNLVLSIDGRQNVNDNMRKTISGKGTYDIIVPKFKKAAESRDGKNYYVRGTFTRENLDFANDVIHLANCGFNNISVEPVVCSDESPYSIRQEDVPAIFEQYDRLVDFIAEREKAGNPLTFFHFMIDLEGGPCIVKRISGCGAGGEYLSVTASGELYPCHQFTGKKEFLIGTLSTGITSKDIYKNFLSCNVYAKKSCEDCFAKFYCSGGCAANAFTASGDIFGVYDIGCRLQRKRTECAITLKAMQTI